MHSIIYEKNVEKLGEFCIFWDYFVKFATFPVYVLFDWNKVDWLEENECIVLHPASELTDNGR